MEFIILGLLQLKPMTGYEIAKFIEGSLNMICSSSAGSIQSAIKKLITNKYISFQESVENGKNKKTFTITAAGEKYFLNWVHNPMQMEKVKNMELSKLFFLGFAEGEKRTNTLKSYIAQLENAKVLLRTIKENFEEINGPYLKDNFHDKNNIDEILAFQGYTLDYGIASVEFEINWYSDLLKKLDK